MLDGASKPNRPPTLNYREKKEKDKGKGKEKEKAPEIKKNGKDKGKEKAFPKLVRILIPFHFLFACLFCRIKSVLN